MNVEIRIGLFSRERILILHLGSGIFHILYPDKKTRMPSPGQNDYLGFLELVNVVVELAELVAVFVSHVRDHLKPEISNLPF